MEQSTEFISNDKKVVIIGAGFVGSSIAYALTIRNLSKDIVLVDIDKVKAEGEVSDIQHGISYIGSSSVRVGDYSDCRNADLIIITAGRNRKSNETRLDMMSDNIRIMKNVVNQIKSNYTKGVIMVVSNPVDVLTYVCDKWMELPNGRVFGTGCLLDTSRLIREIANYTGSNIDDIKGDVVGEHGDSQFPVWSTLTINGMTIEKYCQNTGLDWGYEQKNVIYQRVKKMGASIIAAKGRTHYGIATCVCSLAEAILNQRLTTASVSSTLCGEYNISDVAISVPSIIGANGVEQILKCKWTDEEYEALHHSANQVKNALQKIIV